MHVLTAIVIYNIHRVCRETPEVIYDIYHRWDLCRSIDLVYKGIGVCMTFRLKQRIKLHGKESFTCLGNMEITFHY